MPTSTFQHVHSLQGKAEISVALPGYLSTFVRNTLQGEMQTFGEVGVLFCMPGDKTYCQASRCVTLCSAEQELL